ncbi:MAG: glycosyltransferase family 4 protein [Lachnospiraceae bacterium]|nr:glycosyltransferase family 4 protein [Lachnospiraceae bacterium]
MRIGIDLLWVRVGKCGGTESFVRSLLDGFQQYDTENEYILFAARDNADSFRHYAVKVQSRMQLYICPTDSSSQPQRILWENLHLDRTARKQEIDVLFIPVYSMPWTWGSGIPYVCVIHDLQAMHYPAYFSRLRRMFLRYEWGHTCRRARRVLTDSDYCRQDLAGRFPKAKNKLQIMYVPISMKEYDWEQVKTELRPQIRELAQRDYLYCVSSLLPHKNLDTLLLTVKQMKEQGAWGERLLVISGVGGDTGQLEAKLEDYGIGPCVVQTGYVTDMERDYLYEHCRVFLFPSIFEGFGMPPIEAMLRGKRVVMTRCSCLEEVTQGKAVYVDEPYSPEEWQKKITEASALPEKKEVFSEYMPEYIVRQYMRQWEELGGASDRKKR